MNPTKPSIGKINIKSIARIAAVQVLYQYQQQAKNQDIGVIMQQTLDYYQNSDAGSDHEIEGEENLKIKLSINHFTQLVTHTVNNLLVIDEIITEHLSDNWQICDLSILLLSILRVAMCELKYFPETPKKVIVSEFTDIANSLINEKEIGFVNSILDKTAMEL